MLLTHNNTILDFTAVLKDSRFENLYIITKYNERNVHGITSITKVRKHMPVGCTSDHTGSTFEEMVAGFKIKVKDFPKHCDLATS